MNKKLKYESLFLCRGKIAVVTGGAGLIGREIAKGLHDFGAKVYIVDSDKNKSENVIRGTKIKYIYMDISSERSISKAIDRIKKENGKIDILVNSAYPRTKDWGLRFERVGFKSWKENVNSQLGGYFLCCQKVAEVMKKQKRGSIINLASIYGVTAPDFSIYKGTKMTMPAAYSAIKGGIITFTKYLATYYSEYNIRANVISPGGMFVGQHPYFVKKYKARTPLKRMGKPEDVVGAAIYLASDASSYVTGCNLMVDGGWTAW